MRKPLGLFKVTMFLSAMLYLQAHAWTPTKVECPDEGLEPCADLFKFSYPQTICWAIRTGGHVWCTGTVQQTWVSWDGPDLIGTSHNRELSDVESFYCKGRDDIGLCWYKSPDNRKINTYGNEITLGRVE